mmetsp:Transcript_101072/g.324655  ORF Transcript_101072/g.324655 Transcript_101072/m.324655 type:complete len:112 (-) Transcript_101072:84-419(-)
MPLSARPARATMVRHREPLHEMNDGLRSFAMSSRVATYRMDAHVLASRPLPCRGEPPCHPPSVASGSWLRLDASELEHRERNLEDGLPPASRRRGLSSCDLDGARQLGARS